MLPKLVLSHRGKPAVRLKLPAGATTIRLQRLGLKGDTFLATVRPKGEPLRARQRSGAEFGLPPSQTIGMATRLSLNLGSVGRGSRRAAVLRDLIRLGRSLALPGSWRLSRSMRNRTLPNDQPASRPGPGLWRPVRAWIPPRAGQRGHGRTRRGKGGRSGE